MLYHLSFDVLENIGEFVPRVPNNRMEGEDDTTLRVCCAKTIEGALLAMPDNKDVLSSNKLFPLMKVYELDESKIGADHLLSPNLINDKVPDALSTGEHWITTNIEPDNSYTIQIVSLNYDKTQKTIKELKYVVLTREEALEVEDYFSYDFRIEASEETLMILEDEIIDEDICDLNDLMLKVTNLIEDTIYYISSEPSKYSTDIDNGVELHIDGYYLGEYRDRAFVFQEKVVINEIQNILTTLIDNYKISVEIL